MKEDGKGKDGRTEGRKGGKGNRERGMREDGAGRKKRRRKEKIKKNE